MEPIDRRRAVPDSDSEGIPDLDEQTVEQRMTGEGVGALVVPGDTPQAVDKHGTTAAEQRRGASHTARLRAEVPDRIAADEGRIGQLHVDDRGGADDDEPQAVAEIDEMGRAAPAEEAAVHVRDGGV